MTVSELGRSLQLSPIVEGRTGTKTPVKKRRGNVSVDIDAASVLFSTPPNEQNGISNNVYHENKIW
jgi:hypothetical protein